MPKITKQCLHLLKLWLKNSGLFFSGHGVYHYMSAWRQRTRPHNIWNLLPRLSASATLRGRQWCPILSVRGRNFLSETGRKWHFGVKDGEISFDNKVATRRKSLANKIRYLIHRHATLWRKLHAAYYTLSTNLVRTLRDEFCRFSSRDTWFWRTLSLMRRTDTRAECIA